MIMDIMEKNNGQVPENILRSIEGMWGFTLPKDYRNFLIMYNGGSSKHKIFNFRDSDEGSCVTDFFGFVSDFNNNILIKQRYSGDRFPSNFFPIARDVYGNFILISVKNNDRGKIYFWDHEMEADREQGEIPDYSNLTLIADSFEEFMNGLYSMDMDEEN